MKAAIRSKTSTAPALGERYLRLNFSSFRTGKDTTSAQHSLCGDELCRQQPMKVGDYSNVSAATGIWSSLRPADHHGQLNNPACAAGAAVLRSPFPNNMIPVSRLNQATSPGLLARPVGIAERRASQAFAGCDNWVGNASSGADSEWGDGRVDYNINERHRIFGRYSSWDENTAEIDPFGTHAYPAVLTRRALGRVGPRSRPCSPTRTHSLQPPCSISDLHGCARATPAPR